MLTASLTPLFTVLVVAYFVFVYMPGKKYDRKVAAAGAGRHLAGSFEHAQFVMAAYTAPPAPMPFIALPAAPAPRWMVDKTGTYEHTFTWGAPETDAARDVT